MRQPTRPSSSIARDRGERVPPGRGAARVAFGLALVVALGACGGPERGSAPGSDDAGADALRRYGTLPAFVLTDEQGKPFGSEQLDGKVWVADFVFTRCASVCPMMTSAMSGLQQSLESDTRRDELHLVSFSVDPEHDTPEVLRQYARGAGADERLWTFLTGTREQIWKLSADGFMLGVGEAPGDARMPIFHSQKFVLVDRGGQIRGFYDGLEPEGVAALKRDLRRVLDERYLPRIVYPEEAMKPGWLDAREEAQRATLGSFEVFHDFRFEDRSSTSGITFVNEVTDDSGKHYLPVHYDHGNGIAVADVDGNGSLDVFLTNQLGPNELWLNVGGRRFEKSTGSPGLALTDVISVTASFADTDNDGDADLYVTTLRAGNRFFVNDGQGNFTDVTKQSGLGHAGHSSTPVFFDYDRDGLLDVFLSNIGVYTTDKLGRGGYYVGVPDAFAGHLKPDERNEASLMFRNTGGNRFVDVTEQLSLVDYSWTGDVSPIDLNEDGWLDLYVMNMQGHDQYYENQQGKAFKKKSREVFPRTSWGSMSMKVFDYDNDGDMDIYVTDMHSDMSENIGPEREKLKSDMQWPESLLQSGGASIYGNTFFRNLGNGRFEEISDRVGAENYWPWGLSVDDLNADGYDDVFITSSMNYGFRYGVNSVLLNNRGKTFLDAEFILGVEPRADGRFAKPWFELDCPGADIEHALCKDLGLLETVEVWGARGSRASALFDLDDDGDLDILTNEFHDAPMVLISDLSERKPVRFLKIRLIGTASNRDGLGATVRVTAGGRTQSKFHEGKSGYLSQSRMPLYFGLDAAERVERIEIVWPSGKNQTLPGPIEINRVLEIREP